MAKANIKHLAGSPYEIGFSLGKTLGGRTFEKNIYELFEICKTVYGADISPLTADATGWFNQLPGEYADEARGLADSTGCTLPLIALWLFADRLFGGCTSFLWTARGEVIIGRNNDYIAPKRWSQVSQISKTGCIPIMLFGMEGDLFSGTGYNRERLWLHYNYLPAFDEPMAASFAPYIFMRKALETCAGIDGVEALLREIPRSGAMTLFAVDGKKTGADAFGVLECACNSHVRRTSERPYIAAANHYVTTQLPPSFKNGSENSHARLAAMNAALDGFTSPPSIDDVKRILANKSIEQANAFHGLSGTVYANIACPAQDAVYYAFDGFPAASNGAWERIGW